MPLKRPSSTLVQQIIIGKVDGFTMVELLVTLAIAIVLAIIAVPQYTSTIQSQSTTADITKLFDDLQFARSEAIKEGQDVGLCISSNKTSCVGTTWDQGWIVFSNPTASATFVAGTSILLRATPGFSSDGTITTLPAPATTSMNFNRDGFAVNISTTTGLLFQLHTVTTNSNATRCIWQSATGNQVTQNVSSTAATGQGTNTCT